MMDKVISYRELKAQEEIGSRREVEVVTTLGFLLALRNHREVCRRDELAAMAMQGTLSNETGYVRPESIAEFAYEVADAMLHVQEKTT
jgi:hypothetical protein